MGDGACQRAVGARDDGQPFIGLRGRRRIARIDDDDMCRVHDLAPVIHDGRLLAVRAYGVGRPHEEVLAVLHIVIAIGVHAVHCPRRRLLSFCADGRMAIVVRRTHEGGEVMVNRVAHFGRATLDEHESLGLLVIMKFEELFGYGIEGFIPGDGNETRIDSTAFFGIGALHGGLDHRLAGARAMLSGSTRRSSQCSSSCRSRGWRVCPRRKSSLGKSTCNLGSWTTSICRSRSSCVIRPREL